MKVNNNSIKGALVSLSLAAVLGGWSLLGLDDRRQALSNANPVDDLPDPARAIDEAANYIPMVETIPVSDLLYAVPGSEQEVADLVLEPIPEVAKRGQRAGLGLRPVPQLPSIPGLTPTTGDSSIGSGRENSPTSGSAGAILPGMPDLDESQLSSTLDFPPLPAVTRPSPQPRPVIRTQSSR